jgi:hypothetical protein
MLLSIGDRVETGEYRLHSQFDHATNFVRHGRLVCLVDQTIGAGPLNIVVEHHTFASSLLVDDDSILLGPQRLTIENPHRFCSSLPCAADSSRHFSSNLISFGVSLRAMALPTSLVFLIDGAKFADIPAGVCRATAGVIQRGVDALFAGELCGGVAALKGCGHGLTPSGDDFLAGVLIGLRVLESVRCESFADAVKTIGEAAIGENLFSNNFLEMARDGRVFERMQRLIVALLHGEACDVTRATAAVLAIGSSSGADMATGLYLTLRDEGQFVTRWKAHMIFVPKRSEIAESRA